MAKHVKTETFTQNAVGMQSVLTRTRNNPKRRPEPEEEPGKRNVRRIISNILLIVGIILLLVAAGMYIFSQWSYHEAEVMNSKLAAYATIQEDTKQAPSIDWAGLEGINSDIAGWLYVPDTTINYPVYQGKDNEQYLRHSATGEWSVAGQLFIDYENTKPGMVDNQTIVYGHHLINGTMFEQIAAMDKQDRFDQIPTIWYSTPDKTYELEPLFMYYTTPDDYNARTFNFATSEEWHNYLSGLYSRAVTQKSNASELIGKAEHVMSLITCNYYDGYGRSVLVCAIKSEVEGDASATTDTPTEMVDAAGATTEAQQSSNS